MSSPVAVIIGDLHFTVLTLELATEAFKQAYACAVRLEVPLILNGDTLDTKAIIRAEVANRLIDLLGFTETPVYINTGNHDLLSEKSKESALRFLSPYVRLVSQLTKIDGPTSIDAPRNTFIIPYYSSSEALQAYLDTLPKGSTLIMHQGVQTAYMGHYMQDNSSLPKESYADFRVISGHYHKAQDIKCGRPRQNMVGTFSYVGNPYTLSYGEANDGPKGYAILMEDGTLNRIWINLRKHVIIETDTGKLPYLLIDSALDPKDLIWLKISGPASELDILNKDEISKSLGVINFKLDKIYDPSVNLEVSKEELTGAELFDSIIEGSTETPEEKAYLKKVWKELI